MEEQARTNSNFDTMALRSSLWTDLQEEKANLVCKSCETAKVLYIQKGKVEPPWALWATLFQWLGPPKSGGKWRVFWFPSEVKRLYPPAGEEVGPASLNGGYSYSCRSDTIVVYRKEEATRVLVHEILHAACCDPQDASLPLREANTETWAEILLVALLSGGSERKAKQLWDIQSQWIANQNDILRRRFGIQSSEDYAWRYTLGREEILKSLKIDLPSSKPMKTQSSRLTSPELYA